MSTIAADLLVPQGAQGLVVFAHGSGSGRGSPRGRFVAERLRAASLATLLADLATPSFDLDRLSTRLAALVDHMTTDERTAGLPIGLYGASTGTAAALATAAERPGVVRTVVSRGGRPDLAADHLPRVRQPVLLIVGGEDHQVLDLNREAMGHLGGEVRLEVVPGAAHLFEEPGALDRVAALARAWFTARLVPA
ncbi:dienelactone hydrolase family protein [Dactylosporangium sp. CA-092794]|uniref:dienelactone hydrolase family protein n=1 Tax=Dactylosporangium sp. CA-092794 TaxID=3239929 RepID=UPI003D9221E7